MYYTQLHGEWRYESDQLAHFQVISGQYTYGLAFFIHIVKIQYTCPKIFKNHKMQIFANPCCFAVYYGENPANDNTMHSVIK